MKTTTQERENAVRDLKKLFPAGSTVYTILRSVSRSGMSRKISVLAIRNGMIFHPNYNAALVLDRKLSRTDGQDGIIEKGVGMDMGFHLASSLSYALYGSSNVLKHEWL